MRYRDKMNQKTNGSSAETKFRKIKFKKKTVKLHKMQNQLFSGNENSGFLPANGFDLFKMWKYGHISIVKCSSTSNSKFKFNEIQFEIP